MNEADNRPTFKVGETYAVRAIGDNDIIYAATVVRRTAKTVTFREERRGEYTCRICEGLSQMEGCEAVYPHGRHSMAPVFTADRTLADVTGEKAAQKPADEREAAPAHKDAGDGGRVLVAVYGTLMQGERNEHWAREAGAKVVGEGTVLGWLWDTGWGYPAIQTGGDLMRVAVEVLETDAAGLAHMDVLEGYPNLYGREKVSVRMSDGYTLDALVYQMHDMGETSSRYTLIDPVRGVADWRKYRAGKEGR